MLEAPKEASWKEGVQALVAELLTMGHELRVRAARAQSLDALQQELQQQVEESGASAGVSVKREGGDATALLCRRGVSLCERLHVSLSEGELSRSRLALAVVERLRPLDLPVAPEPAATAPRSVLATVAKPPVADSPRPTPAPRPRLWLGGGAVATSGASAPISWLGASLGVKVRPPWGIEVGLGVSPFSGRAQSYAGSLSLSALQGAAFLMFDPFSGRSFGFELGVGGGALRVHESASPTAGFEGSSRHATVGMLSGRARLFKRLGPLYGGLLLDPGLLVPAVKVEAGTETVLRIGRPWVCLQASLGIEL